MDVCRSQVRVLGEDLVGRHPVRDHRHDRGDRKAQPPDARQPAHDSRVGGDAFVSHVFMLAASGVAAQSAPYAVVAARLISAKATWRLDAAAYAEAAAWAGVPAAVEISRSGDGAHVWTFFSEPVAAADARAMGAALLYEAMAIRGEMDIESYDRLFPAQDYLPRRGFGNLIALPLEGRCRQSRTTLFVDPATFEPYQDQFAYLSSLERMTRRDVVERAEELQPPTVGPAVRLHRSPLAAEPPPPDVIKAELSGMLAIRRAGLPPSLLSSLKHLASVHNPEFYSRQQIGLSVWGAPRMLRCYSESLDRLFLPRGVGDRAAKLIEKAGSRLAITDLRSAPAKLEIEFTGTLRAEQQAAVDAVAGIGNPRYQNVLNARREICAA